MAVAPGAGATHVKFYRTLAIIIGVGAVVASIFALGGIHFGQLPVDSSIFALGVLGLVTTLVMVLFLLRIGAIFEMEGQLNKILSDGEARLEQRLRSQEDAWAAHKAEIRNDLNALKDLWRSEQRMQDDRISEAIGLAANAKQIALEAASNASNSSTKRINEMAPLLAALEAEVKQLRKDLTTVNTKLETTVEALERSEMESSAAKQKAEADLAQLKKREQLMVIKQKELEDQLGANSAPSRPKVTLAPGQDKEHVMVLSSMEPAFASRLNAQGIITLSQLLNEKPEHLAGLIDADQNLVTQWQATAGLLKVKDLTPAQAEALVRVGVTSVKQLSTETPDGLVLKLKEARGKPLNPPATAAQTNLWINAAKKTA